MKPFYTIVVAVLLSFNAHAQYFFLSNFSGTATFGTFTCTVTSTGSVSTGGGICFTAPTEYWAGQSGPGAYIYTVNKPVYHIRVHTWGINGGALGSGEYVTMYVNGAVYPLTAANVISYTECSPGGGPMYLNLGNFMGPVGLTSNYNGGDFFIDGNQSSVCGPINSFELWCNGSLSGVAYHIEMDTLKTLTCITALSNNPCIGDTIKLDMQGDSTASTYLWSGPGGFTSTLQNPFIFPSVFADSGWYKCIKFGLTVNDTDSTHVTIYPKPVVNTTNNSPLCLSGTSTLLLGVSPDSTGETFLWVGPLVSGFTSTLQNPTFSTFVGIDTGIYTVYATTSHGCKDTGYTHVIGIPVPPTPVVTDQNYCQGNPFVPYALSDTVGGDTILWYTVPVGGTGSTTPISVPTLIPGLYHVWVSEKLGSCESLRGTDSVRVTTTPPAPGVTGITEYCQFIGPVIPLTVAHTPTGVARWYYSATGSSFSPSQPFVDITLAGTHNWWVSQVDSGCESPRTPVTLIVHPKPHKPIINPTPICQFMTPVSVSCSPDTTGVGNTLVVPSPFLWYGTGVTPAMSVAPIPPTNIAPDTFVYYVTETTIYGCVSDSAVDLDVIKVKPPVPVTKDIRYCQHATAAKLNALADSIGNSHLNWYYHSVALPPIPTPFTDTMPGTYTWYVSQTVPNDATGCESDSAAINVTIIYKPVFDIIPPAPHVCQFDSIRLSYNPLGQPLFAPSYKWVLPDGALFAGGTNQFDSTIFVQFNKANMNNYVTLYVSDDSGFCTSDTSIYVKVIAQPYMGAFTKPDVCLGDTVLLGLSSVAADAYNFNWYVDNHPLASAPSIRLITSNSNSSGPFEISWLDVGIHVIKVTGQTMEGCKSLAYYDSVNVHPKPDASFQIVGIDSTNEFCLEDSAHFRANKTGANYSYAWAPDNYFNNLNQADIWGKMDNAASTVILTVTDPYGCYATSSQTLHPGTCCTVIFPNAFTPGKGTKNTLFRPILTGFHRFHEFKIVNRWGTTVFEGGNSNVSWDGTYNGVPQDMGTYFYYLKYDCGGKTIEAKGDLTLIR